MNPAVPARFPSVGQLTVLGLLGLLLPVAASRAQGAESATPEAKPFILFMGADVDVQQGPKTYRVMNVARDAFVIAVDGKPQEVQANRGKINLKLLPQLKLSDKTAAVKELKFERAYTPENDPHQKWGSTQAAAEPTANVGANRQMTRSLSDQQSVARWSGPNAGVISSGAGAAIFNTFHQAEAADGSGQNNSGYSAERLREELDKGLFDAVVVTCELSSARPLRDPYLVIVTQYREKDDPPGAVKNWVYAQQLDRLDENPLKVRIVRGGFPPGFEMLKQQVHVYGAGRELGTNVADKNVTLTRDEAHEYIVIDHLTTHKGATLAPTVALGVSSQAFFPHFASVQLQQPVFIRVDKNGLPRGAFHDEKCTEATGDAYLDSLVAQARFKPALQAGQAVDGVAKLKIADLAL